MTLPPYYAFTIEPGRERAAEAILRKRGYDVLVPLQHKQMRPRSGRGLKVLRSTPAVPGYVFVPLSNPEDVAGVFRSRVIWGVLEADGQPGAIPADAMFDFVERVSKWSESVSRSVGVCRGVSVRVNNGAFAGHLAVVEGVRGKWAQIIVQLFGRPSPVRIATASLVVVDATQESVRGERGTGLNRKANRYKRSIHQMTDRSRTPVSH